MVALSKRRRIKKQMIVWVASVGAREPRELETKIKQATGAKKGERLDRDKARTEVLSFH